MEEHQLQAVQRTARATKESIGLQTKRQVALSLSLQVSLSLPASCSTPSQGLSVSMIVLMLI